MRCEPYYRVALDCQVIAKSQEPQRAVRQERVGSEGPRWETGKPG